MHGMTSYFIRRLMLVPVTFVCITFLVYSIQRLAPGGPIEQAQVRLQMAAAQEGGGGAAADGGELVLDEDAIKELQSFYKLHRSLPVGYLIWLGLLPDELG